VTLQSGLNELASALLAVRALKSHLSPAELAQVVTCIEATIAFRASSAERDLAARLVETLAALTGGDAPVSLFMGDLPTDERDVLRLETLLPPPPPAAPGVEPEVLKLLVEGRGRESGFDLKTSPLAAYFYAHLGPAGTDRALAAEDGKPLLLAIPRPVLAEVARACALIAPTRAAPLAALIDSLPA